MKISLVAALTVAMTTQALAQDVEEIVVVGVVPAGASQDLDKVPYPIQASNAADLENMQAVSIADFLKQSFSSISLNDAQNNPLQPDLQYRGFSASPLLGLAQGIAVYQNGVRINEPLGDAVNWDLLPQSAIGNITLSGGANPLFGLNSLGGSLAIDMKDGFNFDGSSIEVSTGSFGRTTANLELGGNDGQLGYYINVESFDEDGWRDHSKSDALSFYGSVGWHSTSTQLNFNYQYGESDLIGFGSSPIELIELDREAIFTGPDITKNDMNMMSLDFSHQATSSISFGGNIFYRDNKTDSFNGDGSDFAICEFGGTAMLLDGLEDDDLDTLGLDDDDICDSQYADLDGLEDFLNMTAALFDEDEFELQGFAGNDLSGTGLLSDQAINNLSDRSQESTGADFQWTLDGNYFGYNGQLILGSTYFDGKSKFNSVVELSLMDPLTRLTSGLGLGAFIDSEATMISTETESVSLYAMNTLNISEEIAVTLSARANRSDVDLHDNSG